MLIMMTSYAEIYVLIFAFLLFDIVLEFHPSMIGLSGTVEECSHAARQYRVYYSKAMTGDDEDDYLVDHSIIMYLIDPNGDFVKFFGKNESVETLSKQTSDIINTWNS